MTVPRIDDRVKHVGATTLRTLNSKALTELKNVLVFQVNDAPVAVMFPYEMYMEIQKVMWPSALLPQVRAKLDLLPEEPTQEPTSSETASTYTVKMAQGDLDTTGLEAFESELLQSPVTPDQPVCAHCGNPNESALCSSCFLAGHRNGDCLQCAERKQ